MSVTVSGNESPVKKEELLEIFLGHVYCIRRDKCILAVVNNGMHIGAQ